jgi:hypothetical protein
MEPTPSGPMPGARAGITGIGIVALMATTYLGAASQVGVQLCAICTGSQCAGSEVCPDSVIGLSLVVAALMVEALVVAVGLAPAPVEAVRGRADVESDGEHPRVARMATLTLSAPFLTFFGWALVALGIILPLNIFGVCSRQCVYTWSLSGYPLVLVIVGGAALAWGTGLFVAQTLRLRRSTPRSAV